MRNKIICNLFLWIGFILIGVGCWNDYIFWLIIPGIILLILSWFFTNESVENRQQRKMDKWTEKHKKKHTEEAKNELEETNH